MSAADLRPPKGRASIALRLCRSCVEYVYEATPICPHCGADPDASSERFRAEGFALREALRIIEDAKAQRDAERPDAPS